MVIAEEQEHSAVTATSTRRSGPARSRSVRRTVGAMAVLAAAFALMAVVSRLVAARQDLLLARSDFRVARAALASGRGDDAEGALRRAERRLRSARAVSTGFPFDLTNPVPLAGSPARAVRAAADAGLHLVDAARLVGGVSASFRTPPSASTHGTDLEAVHDAATRSFDALGGADGHLGTAVEELRGPARARLPFVAGPARALRREVVLHRGHLDRARRGLELLADVTGPAADFRLLVLAQDSLELRPTGGYIGSYGVLRFSAGTMTLEAYEATESLPAPDPPFPPPPDLAPFLPGTWGLSNVNWWPDFPTTAQAAAEMFRRQGGAQVQGVLALTEEAIAALVGAVGPLALPGYDKPVVEAGFAERVVHEVELKKPPDAPRKRFLIELSRVLFDRLAHGAPEQLPEVVAALDRSVGRGDVQLWFADPARQRRLEGTVVEGRLPATTGDFLLLTEANVTASKANLGLVRRATYRVTPQSDGTLRAQLRVDFHNQAPASPVNPYYSGYLRVYVPIGAEVVRAPPSQGREQARDGRYQVLSRLVVVPPLAQRTVTFDYILPASVAPGGRYHLTWLRQPGTARDSMQVVLDGRGAQVGPGERVLQVHRTFGGTGALAWLRQQVRHLLPVAALPFKTYIALD